jgi:hypothetical protein
MNTYYKKPKLVEPKLAKYFINKINEQQTKIAQEALLKVEEETIFKKYLMKIYDFIYNNYGFVLINSLLIILLYVRYVEVSRRKSKMKKIINQIEENTNESDSDYDE